MGGQENGRARNEGGPLRRAPLRRANSFALGPGRVWRKKKCLKRELRGKEK